MGVVPSVRGKVKDGPPGRVRCGQKLVDTPRGQIHGSRCRQGASLRHGQKGRAGMGSVEDLFAHFP